MYTNRVATEFLKMAKGNNDKKCIIPKNSYNWPPSNRYKLRRLRYKDIDKKINSKKGNK